MQNGNIDLEEYFDGRDEDYEAEQAALPGLELDEDALRERRAEKIRDEIQKAIDEQPEPPEFDDIGRPVPTPAQ